MTTSHRSWVGIKVCWYDTLIEPSTRVRDRADINAALNDVSARTASLFREITRPG